ncbi:MAG: PTS transporter subunit EIIC [Erysipelotrichia bacterium]|nr:PTS transporter subunit EIIC [Erysipelotrichia bacterium]
MSRKFENLAKSIIENVGGADNISGINYCMTRLRIKLKDENIVNEDAIKANKEVVSVQYAEGRLQIIIGTQVGEVYEEVIKLTGPNKFDNEDEEKVSGSIINVLASTITKVVVPSLGVLMACGIISGLSSILMALGVIQTGDGAQILLNAMGNACLTFFPVILGYTSANAFGMDPFIGMIIGAILIFPGIETSINSGDVLFTIFADSAFAMPIYKTFLGIPIIFPATGYASTVIPIILINLIGSKIEKFLKEKLPAVTKQFFVPFFTILLTATLGILLVGPISMLLQNALSAALNWLTKVSPFIAYAVIALIYQPLVIFGLHWPLITLGIIEFMANGNSIIIAVIWVASFTHMAACLATFLRTKSIKMKNIAFPAFLSACFCIIEPSIYGVTLPVRKRFIYCMLGGLVGGIIVTATNTSIYAISMGITGFPAFIDPVTKSTTGMIWIIIAVLVAIAITFGLTWVTYKPGEDGKNEIDEVN